METSPKKPRREVRAEKIVKAVQLWLGVSNPVAGSKLAELKKLILEILP